MAVSCKLHDPEVLPFGGKFGTHWIDGWVGRRTGVVDFETRKIPCLYRSQGDRHSIGISEHSVTLRATLTSIYIHTYVHTYTHTYIHTYIRSQYKQVAANAFALIHCIETDTRILCFLLRDACVFSHLVWYCLLKTAKTSSEHLPISDSY
jgi:hypothetical protein